MTSNLPLKSKLNNLLIVEDNTFIGKSIVNAVKNVNTIGDIRITESIQEAILFFNETNFEMVILDLNLPDGNGIELLKILKEKKIESKILVFSTSIELKRICLQYGALAFFDKATDFDNLIEAVKKS